MRSRFAVVFGACLTQFTVIGLLFSFGLFFKLFEAEFGWNRTVLSAASALAFFMMGVLAMLSGPLSDRFGPRRVLLITGIAYGLGFVLMAQITAAWQMFVLFGTLIGLGLGTHDVVTLSTVARWFEARRGIMTAVVKVGTAAGQVVLPPLVAALIAWLGWRDALTALGIAAALLLVLAALSMSAPPPRRAADGSLSVAEGRGFAEARRSRVFWTLCAVQFCFFPTLLTVPLHLPVHGLDLGMSTGQAAALLSVIGASSVAGRLTTGRLVDVIGGRWTFALCLSGLVLSLLGFAMIAGHMALFANVALYGFSHGALFVVVSPTAAEYFGMRALGAIFGVILFSGTIGAALGPILAGLLFDHTGSYVWAFLTLAVMAALALALVLSLPRPARAETA